MDESIFTMTRSDGSIAFDSSCETHRAKDAPLERSELMYEESEHHIKWGSCTSSLLQITTFKKSIVQVHSPKMNEYESQMQYPDIQNLRIDDVVDELEIKADRPLYPSVCTQYLICARECGHPVKHSFLEHNKECLDAKERGESKPCPKTVRVRDKVSLDGIKGWVKVLENGEISGKCEKCR